MAPAATLRAQTAAPAPVAKDPAAEAAALVQQGRQALARFSDWPVARARFESVLALQALYYHPSALLGLASLARAEGRLQEAMQKVDAARQAIATWDDTPFRRYVQAELHAERGRCFLAQGLLDRASLEFDAFARGVAAGDEPSQFTVQLARIDLLLAEQRPYQALELVEQARAAVAALATLAEPKRQAREGELVLRERAARLRLAVEPAEFAALAEELEAMFDQAPLAAPVRTRTGLDAVEAWIGAGDLVRAAACSERLLQPPFESLQRQAEIRAQAARLAILRGADRTQLRTLHRELEATAAELFAQWRQVPLRDGGVGSFYFPARQEVLTALLALDRRVLAGPAAAARALAHLESALSLGTLSRRLGGAAADPAPVLAAVRPPDGGVLAFVLAPQGGHLLLADAAGLDHVEIDFGPGDWEAFAAWSAQLEQRPETTAEASLAALRGLGRRLAERLLPAAVQQRLAGWRGLLLVGAEAHTTALQALPFGASSLGLVLPIAHVPSLSLAASLQRRAAARPAPDAAARHLALLADPVVEPAVAQQWGVDTLALQPAQRERLVGGVAAERLVACWGVDASAARLASAEVRAARALCIVAHGVEDYVRERSAGIVLSPGANGGDALLFAEGVERLQVPPTVALGVCGAAAGPLRLGEDGVQHLGGAFLLAGADHVLLARGQLSLGATVDLLGTFVARLQAGDAPAEALRRARVDIAAVPQRAHPYYFAGLRLLGVGGFTGGRLR